MENIPLSLASLASSLSGAEPVVDDTTDVADTADTAADTADTTDTAASTDTSTDTADTSTDDNDDTSFTSLLKAEFLPDEETDFDPSFDGVKSMMSKVAETHRVNGRAEVLEEMFGVYPDIQDYLDFRMAGGKPEDYFKALAESEVSELDLSSIENQKAVVRAALKGSLSDKMVEATLVTMEETGELEAEAKAYHEKEKAAKSTKVAELTESQKTQAANQKKANDEYWAGINTKIAKGEVGNILIPEKDRKSFFEWLAVPKAEGRNQESLDWEAMSEDDKLKFKYFLYKKGDVASLAQRAKVTSKVDAQVKSLAPGSRMSGSKDKAAPDKINLKGADLRNLTFN